eukprot:m51a1_g10583 hypothetical protein (384) ;mRNA; f:47730-49134
MSESENSAAATASPAAGDAARRYHYRDFVGAEHGPFDYETMRQWWLSGALDGALLVREESEGEFTPLKERKEFPPKEQQEQAEEYAVIVSEEPAAPAPAEDEEPTAAAGNEGAEGEEEEAEEHEGRRGEKRPAPDNEGPESHEGEQQEEGAEETIEDIESAYWYRDMSGQLFGPFASERMVKWVAEGFFAAELPVRQGPDGTFKPLLQHLELANALPRAAPASAAPVRVDAAAAGAVRHAQQMQALQAQVAQQQREAMLAYSYNALNPQYGYDPSRAPALAAAAAGAQQGEPSAAAVGAAQEYIVRGQFNKLTGKFQAQTSEEYWGRRNLPADGALRQIAHYMDYEGYQEARRKTQVMTAMGLIKKKKPKPQPKKKKLLYPDD